MSTRTRKKRNKTYRPRRLPFQQLLVQAVAHHRKGRVEQAEALYRQILRDNPDQPDALQFCGVIAFHRGEHARAQELIQRAITLSPAYAGAHTNLGNIYLETGAYQAAADAYARAAELAPQDPDPPANLAVALRALERPDEAIESFQHALRIDPHHEKALYNLGCTLLSRAGFEEAIAVFRTLVARHPEFSPGYRQLGRCLTAFGRQDEAAELFRSWLAIDPDNPVAQHHYAATAGNAIPDRAADGYVAEIFDRFASSFDAVLARLDYRAPQLMAEAVQALLPAPTGQLAVLDAGCGTGLCGPLLRPYAARLIGVDLSAGMLVKAEQRGGYDKLVKAELSIFLQDHPPAYDLAICADTLCYFGVLDKVLPHLAQSLRPGGLLVFTVEKLEPGQAQDFRLNAHGRYAHQARYVEELLVTAGLTEVRLSEQILRNEAGAPVQGLLVSAWQAGA